ncbi:MAG: hypothetical protein ACYDGS_08590 [Thermoleophilia bacterium]
MKTASLKMDMALKLTRLNFANIFFLLVLSLVSCWLILDCTFDDGDDFGAFVLIEKVSFHSVNVLGTQRLAEAAVNSGVRFI